ncbi:MAG: hypothetical protein JXK94_13720 [Deltaproteobacteria bacterium]|nr:hypothetical protein [Deltaproteobacteria bacterium]
MTNTTAKDEQEGPARLLRQEIIKDLIRAASKRTIWHNEEQNTLWEEFVKQKHTPLAPFLQRHDTEVGSIIQRVLGDVTAPGMDLLLTLVPDLPETVAPQDVWNWVEEYLLAELRRIASETTLPEEVQESGEKKDSGKETKDDNNRQEDPPECYIHDFLQVWKESGSLAGCNKEQLPFLLNEAAQKVQNPDQA